MDALHVRQRTLPDQAIENGASMHGNAVQTLVDKLKEVQSEVQEMGEAGKIDEAHVLRISNLMGEVFKSCESVENEATTNGAYGVGFSTLVATPHIAMYHGIADFLYDMKFVIVLVSVKVETLRIQRNEPSAGPALSATEVETLERWGEILTKSVMFAWEPYFTEPKYKWPPRCPELPQLTEDGEAPQVPPKFQTLVCNLVRMQLNLWPVIKTYLDRWCILGPNIFPIDFWEDDYLHEIMASEPRMVSFVAGASYIDMNDLARSGPIRRSDVARRGAIDTLNPASRKLIQQGVDFLHRVHGGRFEKQHSKLPWAANNYKWPRAENPRIEDLLGDPYQYG